MKPYYEHAGITIYHGDCREVLYSLDRVEFCVFDPPFNLGKDYGPATDDQLPADLYWSWYREVVGAIYPTLKDDSVCYAYHSDSGIFQAKTDLEARGFKYVQTLVWHKPNSFKGHVGTVGNSARWSYMHESALFMKRGGGLPTNPKPSWFMSVSTIPTIQSNFSEGRFHPCQKPTKLLKRLIDFHDGESLTVLDPFCGSGTSLIAAKALQRRAIGIEIEEKYCEIAAKRLSQEVFQFD